MIWIVLSYLGAVGLGAFTVLLVREMRRQWKVEQQHYECLLEQCEIQKKLLNDSEALDVRSTELMTAIVQSLRDRQDTL